MYHLPSITITAKHILLPARASRHCHRTNMGEPNIGVIGLDKPGFALAACLARKGHRLLVRDADPTQGIRFVEEHATSRIATSDEDSFQHCNVVIINLANGNVAKELLLGQQGIAPHLKPGMTSIPLTNFFLLSKQDHSSLTWAVLPHWIHGL